jgi:iron complex transport system ATP-binding protein
MLADMSGQIVLQTSGVTVRRGEKNILGPITISISEGERWVILGPNGAGKSTLLSILAANSHPTSGSVTILGERLGKVDVFELRPRIGICSALLSENIPYDEIVRDVVMTAAYAVLGRWQEGYDLWDESRAVALLTTLGVRDLSERYFGTLSEGERKRVQIARALMSDPEILLLDEPAAGLDVGGREDLLSRLSTLAQDPHSPVTILVTHHIEEIPVGTTHALLLKDGIAAVSGPLDQVITSEHVSAVFGLPIEVAYSAGRFSARAI